MNRPLHPPLLVIGLLLAACATAPGPAPAAKAPQAEPLAGPSRTGLRMVVSPQDAHVEIDGVAMGTAASLGGGTGVVPLAPGVHRVSVRRAGYATWRAEVAVRSELERLEVVLVERE